MLDVGRPQPGETVLVSGAAGAVGCIAGQIAKLAGCRVVGTTGGADKCAWLTSELGFDAAIDYKAGGIHRQLKAICPEGVDVWPDNTGGEVLDAALARMNLFGRVVCCGNISQYNATTPAGGPAGVPGFLVTKRIRMEGFVVMDFYSRRQHAEAMLGKWVSDGKLIPAVDIVEGFDNMPKALAGMFAGREPRLSARCGFSASPTDRLRFAVSRARRSGVAPTISSSNRDRNGSFGSTNLTSRKRTSRRRLVPQRQIASAECAAGGAFSGCSSALLRWHATKR